MKTGETSPIDHIANAKRILSEDLAADESWNEEFLKETVAALLDRLEAAESKGRMFDAAWALAEGGRMQGYCNMRHEEVAYGPAALGRPRGCPTCEATLRAEVAEAEVTKLRAALADIRCLATHLPSLGLMENVANDIKNTARAALAQGEKGAS